MKISNASSLSYTPTTDLPVLMNLLSSIELRETLEQFCDDDIRNQLVLQHQLADDRSVQIITLGYMIASGRVNDVVSYLEQLGEHATDIINARHEWFYHGTCLHMALFYNSGAVGHHLFTILLNHGALFYLDYYHSFPWQQLGFGNTLTWIHPITRQYLGERSDDEFINFYEQLVDLYELGSIHPNNIGEHEELPELVAIEGEIEVEMPIEPSG